MPASQVFLPNLNLKQHLIYFDVVNIALGALSDVRPANWCLTHEFDEYLHAEVKENEPVWAPTGPYYLRLIARFVNTLQGKEGSFPKMDWRFNEFPNEGAHALHVTCVEIMGLPVDPNTVWI